MAYQDESAEVHRILGTSLGEAQEFVHPQIGDDHVFLAMLQEPYASTRTVLRHYENRLEEARDIVRGLTKKWVFKKKRGKVKLPTATPEFNRVRVAALQIARDLNGPTAECEARHFLEAMLLEVRRAELAEENSNLLTLLNKLQIDYRALLASVQGVNRPVVMS